VICDGRLARARRLLEGADTTAERGWLLRPDEKVTRDAITPFRTARSAYTLENSRRYLVAAA
jgi:hypothetical protein